MSICFFFFNDTATTEIYTLSLHDALPILENQSSTGMPTTHGCIEDSARQAGIAGAAEPPSEHPTGALVQHDGEKAPPTTDWEIGDVADPDLIGTRGDAGPQAAGMLAVEPMQPRIRAVDLHDPRAQTGGSPQGAHPGPRCR